MKKFIYLLAIGLMISFASCTEELEYATINYEIATRPTADISGIEIDFSFLRAVQQRSDNDNTALRTVYLESAHCDLSDDKNWSYSLGQSDIEPSHIEALDLKLGCQITITSKGATRVLKFARPDPGNFENLDLDIFAGDQIDVTFVLDVAASSIREMDGEQTFFPVFETIINKQASTAK